MRRLVFDFDDAVWLRDSYSAKGFDSPRREVFGFFHKAQKFRMLGRRQGQGPPFIVQVIPPGEVARAPP